MARYCRYIGLIRFVVYRPVKDRCASRFAVPRQTQWIAPGSARGTPAG